MSTVFPESPLGSPARIALTGRSELRTWDEVASHSEVRIEVSTGPRRFRTKQDVRDHIAELMRFIPALPDELPPVEDNFEAVRELDAATRADYPERS